MASARAAALLALAVVTAACGNSGATETSGRAAAVEGTVAIPNQGGSQEGHTPTGFAGSGTGLFAGDNLNSSFPEGVGVQTYLTFTLPDDLAVGRATLTSDALHTAGAPFDDLGSLLAEPVEYSQFSPALFDLPAGGEAIRCELTSETTVACDVTAAVQEAVGRGRQDVQFRLRFEQAADNDGQPDLALFYRQDSNTNEPGLFQLTMTP